jgi:hypothetical protein
MFSLPFGLGIAHYDQPPDELPDVEALLAAEAIRFANQLHAWIEVDEGHITGHGMAGGGRLGSTTVRLRSHGLTCAGVALPDLTPRPETAQGRVRFTNAAGGHTGAPVPRAVARPPFLAADRPDRLVHHHADPALRRVLADAARRREPVPLPLPLVPDGSPTKAP